MPKTEKKTTWASGSEFWTFYKAREECTIYSTYLFINFFTILLNLLNEKYLPEMSVVPYVLQPAGPNRGAWVE